MTLEELKSKTVTITVNKSFKLAEDLDEDTLIDILEEQALEAYSDEELLYFIADNHYKDYEDILDYSDYNITIQ